MKLVDIALSGGAMRTALLFVIIVVMVIWFVITAYKGILQEIPAGVVTLIGMLIGGKAAEKFTEKKETK